MQCPLMVDTSLFPPDLYFIRHLPPDPFENCDASLFFAEFCERVGPKVSLVVPPHHEVPDVVLLRLFHTDTDVFISSLQGIPEPTTQVIQDNGSRCVVISFFLLDKCARGFCRQVSIVYMETSASQFKGNCIAAFSHLNSLRRRVQAANLSAFARDLCLLRAEVEHTLALLQRTAHLALAQTLTVARCTQELRDINSLLSILQVGEDQLYYGPPEAELLEVCDLRLHYSSALSSRLLSLEQLCEDVFVFMTEELTQLHSQFTRTKTAVAARSSTCSTLTPSDSGRGSLDSGTTRSGNSVPASSLSVVEEEFEVIYGDEDADFYVPPIREPGRSSPLTLSRIVGSRRFSTTDSWTRPGSVLPLNIIPILQLDDSNPELLAWILAGAKFVWVVDASRPSDVASRLFRDWDFFESAVVKTPEDVLAFELRHKPVIAFVQPALVTSFRRELRSRKMNFYVEGGGGSAAEVVGRDITFPALRHLFNVEHLFSFWDTLQLAVESCLQEQVAKTFVILNSDRDPPLFSSVHLTIDELCQQSGVREQEHKFVTSLLKVFYRRMSFDCLPDLPVSNSRRIATPRGSLPW